METKNTKPDIIQVENGLLEIVSSQISVPQDFNAETTLADVGLESLSMVRILVLVDQKFGVWLEGGTLTPENLKNVRSMASCLHALL